MSGFSASLCVDVSGNNVDYILKGNHEDDCNTLNGITAHKRETLNEDGMVGLDLSTRFSARCEEMAVNELTKSGLKIWQEVRNEFLGNASSAGIRIPPSDVVSDS